MNKEKAVSIAFKWIVLSAAWASVTWFARVFYGVITAGGVIVVEPNLYIATAEFLLTAMSVPFFFYYMLHIVIDDLVKAGLKPKRLWRHD